MALGVFGQMNNQANHSSRKGAAADCPRRIWGRRIDSLELSLRFVHALFNLMEQLG